MSLPAPSYPVPMALASDPKWVDIAGGGGGTNLTVVDPAYSAERVADNRVYRFARNLLDSMKQFRKAYDENWDYYFNILLGRQWVQPNSVSTRSPRMQNWRARLNINYTYAIMDTMAATVFDTDPRLSIQGKSTEQEQYVDMMQAAMDQVWYDQKCVDKCQDAFFNALTFGIGVLKLIWNPEAHKGQGAIEVHLVPTENFYVSSETGEDLQQASAVAETRVTPLSQLKRQFPKKAEFLRADAHQGTYGEKKSTGSALGTWPNRPVELYSPSDDQPRIAEKTVFSAPPWRTYDSRNDALCEVTEVWLKDYSKKSVDVQYIAGHDIYGRPVYGTRKDEVDAYPNGRLITIGGGIVLQDVPAPYRVFPYVIFRDIVRTGEFYGRGEPELLIDLQIEFNKRRSQIMDNAALTGNGVYIADRDCGVPPHMIVNNPGQIIYKNKNSEFRRDNPPEMPGWIMQAADLPVQDMFLVSGVSGAGAAPPRGIRSGAGMQEAQAYMTQRIRRKGKRVESALVDMGRIMVTMIQDFYTTPRMVRINGSLGYNAAFVPFDRWHARGEWDLKVEAGAAMAATKTARRQESIQLYQLGVIDDIDLLEKLEWPGRWEILRRKGRQLPPQVPQYPGWPGMPNPNSSDNSGYSLSVRSQEPPPGPPPGAAPPPGMGGPMGAPPPNPLQPPKPPKPTGGSLGPRVHKPKKPVGIAPMMTQTFQPYRGVSKSK